MVEAAKALKGSKLNDTEVNQARDEFKARWKVMGSHSAFEEAHTDWATTPVQQRSAPSPYRLIWGGGCSSTPLTCEEVHAYHRLKGWPTDKELQDDEGPEHFVRSDTSVEFNDSYNLFGVGQWARNVNRDTVRSKVAFEIIESGLNNFAEHLGRAIADEAETMLIIKGPSLQSPDQTRWVVAILSGTTYSPKVLDFTMCHFRTDPDSSSQELELPCDVCISHRASKMSDAFECIDTKTGDEFIDMLLKMFSAMTLLRCVDEIILEHDNSIKWSRISDVSIVGRLWEPGMSQPLLQRELQQSRAERKADSALDRLQTSDPLQVEQAHRRNFKRAPTANCKRSANQPAWKRSRVSDGDAGCDRGDGSAGIGLPLLAPGAIMPPLADATDLREDEGGVSADSGDELVTTYVDAVTCTASDAPALAGTVVGDDLPDLPDAGNPDPAFADDVAAGVAEMGAGLGLSTEGGSSSSGAERSDPYAPEQYAAPPEPPWRRTSDPSPMGYCYYEGRHVLRVQRGKPAGSVSVTCARHPRCTMLLTERLCPSNETLKEWLWEGDIPEGTSREGMRALGEIHMKSGKSRWTVSGQKAAWKAAAASS